MNAEGKIKEKQPGNSKQHSNKKLTEKEIEELMGHSAYKKRGGVIRQVRQG